MMASKFGFGSLNKKKRTTRIRPLSLDPDPPSSRNVAPSRRSTYFSSSSSSDEDEPSTTKPPPKKRRIDEATSRGTPMPPRAMLVDVLDQLQKKDTYGVFARPVNLDELPDYHDVIEHPMDFGTVRRKLGGGIYRWFEHFEDDVYLICSNAMQYNAPDTIYFRQASSIEDAARRKFQELRVNPLYNGATRKNEETTSFYSAEKKTLTKPQCRNESEAHRSINSSMKKIIKKPHSRTAPHQLSSELPSVDKKMLKERQYQASFKHIGPGISSLDKKTLKDVNGRVVSNQPRSDISSMETNTLRDPYRKPAHEPAVSNMATLKKKILKKPLSKVAPQSHDSNVSPRAPYRETAHEPHVSRVTSLGKKMLKKSLSRIDPRPPGNSTEIRTSKKTQCRTRTEPFDSDISSMEKKVSKTELLTTEPRAHVANITSLEKKTQKKPRVRIVPQLFDSDNSSENKKSEKAECREKTRPLDSDISSLEKKALKTAPCRTAPEPHVSDTSLEKRMLKKPRLRIVPHQFESDITSENKTSKSAQSRTVTDPLDSDISSRENKESKVPGKRVSEPHVSDSTSVEREMLKTPQSRAVPPLFGCDMSSDDKTFKKAQCRTVTEPLHTDTSLEKKESKAAPCEVASERRISSTTSLEKKRLKKPQSRNVSQLFDSGISSENITSKKAQSRTVTETVDSVTTFMEKKTPKTVSHRTAPEPHASNISSLEKKTPKTVPHRTAPEPHASNISSLEKKTLKKPQSRIEPQPHELEIFSENKISKKPKSRMLADPLDSGIYSDKKALKMAPCRTAPRPLGSDASFTATHASGLDTRDEIHPLEAKDPTPSTYLSKAQGEGLPSATEVQTKLSSEQVAVVTRTGAVNGPLDGCVSPGDSISEGLPSASEIDPWLSSEEVAVGRSRAIDGFVDGSSPGESIPQKADEVPAENSPSELEQMPFEVDENRRTTYNMSDQQEEVVDPDYVFDVFEDDSTQLVPVGIQSEYGYARSLARFATFLGPIAWEIISQKIEQALPPGVKFGPGWVGEYEPLPSPVIYVRNRTQSLQQQQQELLKPQVVPRKEKGNITKVSRKDKRRETNSASSQNSSHRDIPFSLHSQSASEKVLTGTSTSVEGITREKNHFQKQGLFGIDFTTPRAVSSSMPQNLKKQATGGFPNPYSNEVTINRPQLSSEVTNFKFPAFIPMGTNQVHAEPWQQLKVATTQERNDVVANITNLNTWRTPPTSSLNTSFVVPNQQPGVQQYWSSHVSNDQATTVPLRWMSSSEKNITKISSNNLERFNHPNMIHLPRQDNPGVAAGQTWMSFGAPSEWKPVGGNNQGRTALFKHAPSITSASSRFDEDSRKQEAQNKGLVIFPQLMTTTDLSRLSSPWQDMVPHHKQKDHLPPDLNISFQPPEESPARTSSGINLESQHPDLALQL